MVRRRIEVWSTPDDPGGFRWLCSPPVVNASMMDRDGTEPPGSGSITVPATYEHLDLIIDLDPSDVASSAAASLIVVYQELPNPASGSGEPDTLWTPVFEFFAEDHSEQLTDDGPVVTISGPEIRSALDDGIVFPKSTFEPHYQWGAPTVTANADLAESAVQNEELTVWIIPDGVSDPSGTWTLIINGQQTSALQWDATPSDIKTAIDAAVTTITEALVSGQGTADDPWYIVLVDDPPTNQTVVSTSSIVDGELRLSIEIEGGQAFPNYWQKSQTYDGFVFGNHGGGSMAVVDDPDGGAGKALRIIGTTPFIGAQQIIDVEPGSTGYGSVEIYTGDATAEFRLVLRTLDGGFVASSGGSGGYEGQTVTADTWTTLEILNTQLLDEHGDRLILRAAVVSEGNPSVFYLRNLEWHPGLPGTTAGDISQILLGVAIDDASRGVLEWLDTSTYDASTDTDGVSWDESALAFQADAGEQLGTHVHGDLQQMAYELDLVRIPDDELGSPGSGVQQTHYLQMFNPGGRGPAADLNTAIVIGAGIGGGTISKRRVPFTHLLVETYDAGFVEVTDARVSSLPRREAFLRADQARDAATATKIGEAVLDAMIENLFATQVELVGDSIVAYRDFDIGSTVPYTLGASRASRHSRRVHTISMSFDGSVWRDSITASRIFPGANRTGQLGADSPLVLEALRKLYARFDRKRLGSFSRSGSGAVERAPAAAVLTGAFAHLERSTSQQIAMEGEAIEWDAVGIQGSAGWDAISTSTEITIPKTGYYNVGMALAWATSTDGGAVAIERTRSGSTVQIWPPTSDPGVAEATAGDLFEGTAHALPLQAGDTLEVILYPLGFGSPGSESGTEQLATATASVYMVDREDTSRVSYSEVVIDDGPLAYWRLGETSGSVAADSSGSDIDGTYENSPTLGQPGIMRDGFGDPSAYFPNTADEHVAIDDLIAQIDGLTTLTVEAWIQPDNVSALNPIVIVNNYVSAPGTGANRWTFWLESDQLNWQEGNTKHLSTATFSADTRYHVVAVRDTTPQVKLYINGELDSTHALSTANTASLSDGDSAQIGLDYNDGPAVAEVFEGSIDEVAIYTRALTAAEILEHWQTGSQGF